MTDELPEGWAEAPLRDLLISLESGSRPRGGVRGIPGGFPSVGAEHLDREGGFNFASVKYIPREFFQQMRRGVLRQGDVLVVKDGATTGRVSLVGKEFPFKDAAVNEHVFVCRPAAGIEPAFLFRFLWSEEGRRRIMEHFHGGAQGGINQAFADEGVVPIAPLAEQRRIVAKVEALLTQVNAARTRLARIPPLLKRLRQSILAAAFSGALTKAWRDKNPIQSETVDLDEQDDVDQDGPPPYGVPLPWTWTNLRRLGRFINGDRSKNYPSKALRVAEGIPFINAGHLKDGIVDLKEMDYITAERFALLTSGKVQEGDVLYCLRGSLGKAGMVVGIEKGAIASSLLIVRVDRRRCLERFIYYYLSSPLGKEMVKAYDNGSAQPNLSAADVGRYLVPLPPIGEQHEIVRQVDSLFTIGDTIEGRVRSAATIADTLSQSALSRAFSGNLVLTEAELARQEERDYEPASALLDRVHREQSRLGASRTPGRQKRVSEEAPNG